MSEDVSSQAIETVRAFSRFYTRRIGVLREGVLASPYSLTEVRILYELAHHDDLTASRLARDLELDAGYLSRILRGFERQGLIVKTRSAGDKRQLLLQLSERGRQAFEPLNRKQRDEVAAILAQLTKAEQSRLVGAMQTIERLMGERSNAPVVLRECRPGDLGWIIQQHALEMTRHGGWSTALDADVACGLAKLIRQLDHLRDRIWIAERSSVPVGCAILTSARDNVATVKSLLVEPGARQRGVGEHLLAECVAFARATGCAEVRLTTMYTSEAVEHLVRKLGFSPITSDNEADGETAWRLVLEA